MDFFLWGVVKENIYERKPAVLQFRDFITEAFAEISENEELCKKVCNSVEERIQECINAEDGLLEHPRD